MAAWCGHGQDVSAKSSQLPQPDPHRGRRPDRQVVQRELLVEGGHPPELSDPSQETLHLVTLAAGGLVERPATSVITRALQAGTPWRKTFLITALARCQQKSQRSTPAVHWATGWRTLRRQERLDPGPLLISEFTTPNHSRPSARRQLCRQALEQQHRQPLRGRLRLHPGVKPLLPTRILGLSRGQDL